MGSGIRYGTSILQKGITFKYARDTKNNINKGAKKFIRFQIKHKHIKRES